MFVDLEWALTFGVWSLIVVMGLVACAGTAMGVWVRRQKRAEARSDAQSDARRWYDMLGRQLALLSGRDDDVAARALKDASDRYAAAAGQLAEAVDIAEFHQVRRTATEGLRYIGVARARLGLVAGPQGPPPVAPDGRPMYEERYRAVAGTWDEYDRNERSTPLPAVIPGVTGLIRPR
ncbi:MAG: hypothetical protein ACRDXX_10285 [Stackebrandtia sp.]